MLNFEYVKGKAFPCCRIRSVSPGSFCGGGLLATPLSSVNPYRRIWASTIRRRSDLSRTYDLYELEDEKRSWFALWEREIVELARKGGVMAALAVPECYFLPLTVPENDNVVMEPVEREIAVKEGLA